jgi:hypothetical protein
MSSARIEVPASATPHEAAALVAAVEQFLRDTTVAVVEAPRTDGWTRVARAEAVLRGTAWDAGPDASVAAWAA